MAKAKLKQARMRCEWEGKRRLLQEKLERDLKKTGQLVEGEKDFSTVSTAGTGCSSVDPAAAHVASVISGQESAYVSATRSTGGDASPEQDHTAFEGNASTSVGAATGAVSTGLFSDCMTTAGQGRELGVARPKTPASNKNNSKHRGKLRSKDEQHSLPFWSVQVADVETAARTSDGLAAAVMGRGYVSASCSFFLPCTANAQSQYTHTHTLSHSHICALLQLTHTGC